MSRTLLGRDRKRGMVVIDEKKVALMTKLAIYEKHEKTGSLVMSRYYETDYVRFNVLKTWIAATVAYWIIVGAYAFMSFDDMLAKVNDIDYFDLMYRVLGAYALFCIVYYILGSILYRYRYFKARAGLVEYNSNLRELIETEGGPIHRVRLAHETTADMTAGSERAVTSGTAKGSAKTTVRRSDIVKRREEEEEQRRNAEIIDNVRRRNARIAEQNEEKLRKQRQAEEDRRRIQERRRRLEQEQMERIRNERMQQMQRENHVYNNTDGYERSNR